MADQLAFVFRRNERFHMAKPLRRRFRLRKKRKLLVQVAVLGNANMRPKWGVKGANKDVASTTCPGGPELSIATFSCRIQELCRLRMIVEFRMARDIWRNP